jgi:hypothetical protein
MYGVPLPVYALMSGIGLVEMPDEGTPGQFMISVLVVKSGVALGFVLLLRFASGVFAARWPLYGAIWWLMFAIVEDRPGDRARLLNWRCPWGCHCGSSLFPAIELGDGETPRLWDRCCLTLLIDLLTVTYVGW